MIRPTHIEMAAYASEADDRRNGPRLLLAVGICALGIVTLAAASPLILLMVL